MITEDELRALTRQKIEEAKPTTKYQYQWARRRGISEDALNNFLNMRKAPPANLLVALGLRKIVGYEKIEP